MSYHLGPAETEEHAGLYADPREAPAPQPRRLLTIAAGLAVMVLFAGGLWLAYIAGTRHAVGSSGTDVPLIRADARPDKVKPDKPGGLQIPDRNMLIYGENRNPVEHLLPPPEQPMARPTAPPSPSAAAAPPPEPVAASPEAAAPPPPKPSSTQKAAAPTAIASGKKPEAVRASPAKSGGVRLQLAAVRSEEVARREWDRIKRKNHDLLGNLTASAIRADLGDKGVYYRIRTAPVGDFAAADRICGALKERNVGCIVIR
ncbi:MAG TPA: SPOR domain-containing protein [Stellaceae bacterium]|jgi:cell division septation protein DedD